MNKIINILHRMTYNISELLISSVFVISMLPFFLHNHGCSYYSLFGGWITFWATLSAKFKNKKASNAYNILCIIVLLLGIVSMFILANKKGTYTNFELCSATYLGGLMGIFIGNFINDFIEKEKQEKILKKQSEINYLNKQKERKEILETYKWIKVKKYKDDENLTWQERYKNLEDHHIEETTFLIEKIREITK